LQGAARGSGIEVLREGIKARSGREKLLAGFPHRYVLSGLAVVVCESPVVG
jgi:hypothetical protein